MSPEPAYRRFTLSKGSHFTVEIPHKRLPTLVELGKEIGSKVSPYLAGLRILIVEDNLMNQKIAIHVIKRLGHSPQAAANGQEALDRLQEEDFDLVLMDIQMPVMDGYTATRHIRTSLRNDIPIVALTASITDSVRDNCLQAGINDFLDKPFEVEALKQILHKYCSTLPAKFPLSTNT